MLQVVNRERMAQLLASLESALAKEGITIGAPPFIKVLTHCH